MPVTTEKPGLSSDPDEQVIPDYILNPDMEMPIVEIDGDAYIGTLEIPVLGLSLPVMSDWSYPKLKTAPCRYAGTAYKSGFVVAGHNYRRHFGTLSRLAPGDLSLFTCTLDGQTRLTVRCEKIENRGMEIKAAGKDRL